MNTTTCLQPEQPDSAIRTTAPGSARKRVCVIAPSLRLYGGQSVQAARLIEGLNQEPDICAELLPINPQAPGLLRPLQRVKYLRTLVTEAIYLWLLLTRIPRADLVHIYSAAYLSFALAPTPALLLARLFGKPALLNYHSGEAADHLTRWRRTALPVMRLAQRVIVPSEWLAGIFARFGITAEVIQNTVEAAQFRFHERCPLRPVLLSNRNFECHYNVADTLRAFAIIERRMPQARLIVAGDGSEREQLRQLAAELKLTQIEFTGAVPPGQIAALYDRADIFINASVVDNQPLSIIEAFACGLAVVTTGAGGIPQMVRHGRNGIVVEPGDYRALAEAVLSLCAPESNAAEMVSQALADSRHYTWSAVRSRWLELYASMLKRPLLQPENTRTI